MVVSFKSMKENERMAKERKEIEDILLKQRPDRRLLPHVPDPTNRRKVLDRRKLIASNTDELLSYMNREDVGVRYLVDYEVVVTLDKAFRLQRTLKGKAVDISATGIGLVVDPDMANAISSGSSVHLKFTVTPGTLPEGLEMKVNVAAKCVRTMPLKDGRVLCGMEFAENLLEYANRKRGRYILPTSAMLLFVICGIVILMRADSVVYFKFNKTLYLYSIMAATFLLSRYFFGAMYRTEPVDAYFTPSVTIIVPCFNEETWIDKTILGCMDQYYPPDKLSVIVVDDCSSDRSVEVIKDTVEKIIADQGEAARDRIKYLVQPVNKGKRDAMAWGAKEAKTDLVVFVDSDSFLNPYAILNLVQPFKDNEVGGVSGRTDVANTYTNALTKMQSVRYYIAFRIMKACESYFDTVTCLSGPLSCYRRDLVLKYCDGWLNQKFLGQRATFGDDRSMTNNILRYNRTVYQDTAVCYTIVPNSYDQFLKQQMRWKRSWLRESLIAAKFMWKKEPFASITFYMGVLVPILAPIIVIYNLIYIPLSHRVFPTTFLMGMAFMAAMMSVCQLLLRKSTTWLFGIWFCLYYEAVLLWQMPVAWFTFWKSTWGTRMTPADVRAQAKKKHKNDKNSEGAEAGSANSGQEKSRFGVVASVKTLAAKLGAVFGLGKAAKDQAVSRNAPEAVQAEPASQAEVPLHVIWAAKANKADAAAAPISAAAPTTTAAVKPEAAPETAAAAPVSATVSTTTAAVKPEAVLAAAAPVVAAVVKQQVVPTAASSAAAAVKPEVVPVAAAAPIAAAEVKPEVVPTAAASIAVAEVKPKIVPSVAPRTSATVKPTIISRETASQGSVMPKAGTESTAAASIEPSEGLEELERQEQELQKKINVLKHETLQKKISVLRRQEQALQSQLAELKQQEMREVKAQ